MGKNIVDAPFMRELIATCSNMYRLGWNERNGGNISVLLDDAEIAEYAHALKPLRQIDVRFDASELSGKTFAVTGTGKYFKNVETDPSLNLGILRICPDGKTADILWGFSDGGRPTSELPAHLRSHIARLQRDPRQRVVMHCHATNTLAMTFLHPLDEREFTRTLWKMCTECIVVFPEGVGVLPWMLCGNDEIGKETAKKMQSCRICIWAQHGIFGAGTSLDETFGLIETVEKAAEIFIKIGGQKIVTTIQDRELKVLAEAFGVDYRKDYLE
ncbi:MAG: rhamnulose-1-phosphate aldolase [Treponemataceae bacterium]|nr:MAG: rhamnulose-1-phosphate aldolase [Treponemataceae bacterium]